MNNLDQQSLTPFLKWPGGKRWFVRNHSNLLPTNFNRYIEPFLGSGAVFFHLQPKKALIGDINPDVLSMYLGLKNDWKYIKRSLQYHERMHSEKYYYEVRGNEPTEVLRQASRMIYLNRTCFNGIYRVNEQGEFNVPKGSKVSVILDTDDFEKISKALKGASIHFGDFEDLINKAEENDFVFADPPYTVRHNHNGFIKYNEKLFSWADQQRLSEALVRASERGAKIVCTNADHTSIRNLYRGKGFKLKSVSRYSSISATSDSRKQFEELVILSK